MPAPKPDAPGGRLNKNVNRGSAVGSMALCDYLGITFRRLDYLARRSSLAEEVGSGQRRVWTPELIRVLKLSVMLTNAMPRVQAARSLSAILPIMEAVRRNPPTVDEGYVWWQDGEVAYSEVPPDLEPGEGRVIVRYDDLWPLDDTGVPAKHPRPQKLYEAPPFVAIEDTEDDDFVPGSSERYDEWFDTVEERRGLK